MITVYSNGCPRCMILEKKLVEANVQFKICDDPDILMAKGFDLMPVMEIDGELLDFGTAIKWVNERG